MKKDVIFITALTAECGDDGLSAMAKHLKDYLDFSLKTWRWWCEKNNVHLYVFSKSDMSMGEMGPCWQRWYAPDILRREGIEYRRIAILDADTMIRWDCPNFFNFYRGSYCGVACSSSWASSECDYWVYKSLKQFKPYFPEIDIDWERYIDNGMVLLPEGSEEFTKTITDFYWKNHEQLKYDEIHNYAGTDQTPVNYLATKYYGDNIKCLSKKYNMMHLNLRGLLKYLVFLDSGYIWQFNGFPNKDRHPIMRETWEKIKHHYK